MNKVERILNAVRESVYPLTKIEVSRGNHVFGGAVLDAHTLDVLMVGSNNRVDNPIFHGEIDTLNRFFRLPPTMRPQAGELIFLATHDPCPMCAAAIAWAGFREVWTLFDYRDVQDDFGMPVDLMMYRDLLGSEGARRKNSFYEMHNIKDAVEAIADKGDRERLSGILGEVKKLYAGLEVHDFDYPGMA